MLFSFSQDSALLATWAHAPVSRLLVGWLETNHDPSRETPSPSLAKGWIVGDLAGTDLAGRALGLQFGDQGLNFCCAAYLLCDLG